MPRRRTLRALALGLIATFHAGIASDVLMLQCMPTDGSHAAMMGMTPTMPMDGGVQSTHEGMGHGDPSDPGQERQAPSDHTSCTCCCLHGPPELVRPPAPLLAISTPVGHATPADFVELSLDVTPDLVTLPNPPPSRA